MTTKTPWYQSQGVSAFLGILAILVAVFAFGDRQWVPRDTFDSRMDRLEARLDSKLEVVIAEIRRRHDTDTSRSPGYVTGSRRGIR